MEVNEFIKQTKWIVDDGFQIFSCWLLFSSEYDVNWQGPSNTRWLLESGIGPQSVILRCSQRFSVLRFDRRRYRRKLAKSNKHSPHNVCWYKRFTSHAFSIGFEPSTHNKWMNNIFFFYIHYAVVLIKFYANSVINENFIIAMGRSTLAATLATHDWMQAVTTFSSIQKINKQWMTNMCSALY